MDRYVKLLLGFILVLGPLVAHGQVIEQPDPYRWVQAGGGKIDCSIDQLNPACVPYVTWHSEYHAHVIQKLPPPPPAQPPVSAPKVAAPSVIPPVKPTVEPAVKFETTPQPSIPPMPTTTSNPSLNTCDEKCQNMQSIGANGASLAIGLITLAAQHHKNSQIKKFCKANADSCADGLPCSFDPDVESIRKYAVEASKDGNDTLALVWADGLHTSQELSKATCYHDFNGIARRYSSLPRRLCEIARQTFNPRNARFACFALAHAGGKIIVSGHVHTGPMVTRIMLPSDGAGSVRGFPTCLRRGGGGAPRQTLGLDMLACANDPCRYLDEPHLPRGLTS